MILLVAGIFGFGRLADDDVQAMVLTTAWFGLVLGGGLLVARRRRDLRLPMAAGYGVVAVAAAILLGLPMLGDDVVNERVVVGVPAPEARAAASDGRTPRNVQVARGEFDPDAHPGSGTAAVVELPGGERKLTLTEFETDNGPDLRVYLAEGNPAAGEELGEFEDLGGLKGNVGDQQYDVPPELDLSRYSNAVIWCRAFSVGFTAAPLEQS